MILITVKFKWLYFNAVRIKDLIQNLSLGRHIEMYKSKTSYIRIKIMKLNLLLKIQIALKSTKWMMKIIMTLILNLLLAAMNLKMKEEKQLKSKIRIETKMLKDDNKKKTRAMLNLTPLVTKKKKSSSILQLQ